MTLLNRVLTIAIVISGFCLPAHGQGSPKTVGDIFNFHRVIKGELYRSGQLQKDEYELLKAHGIKTVISLNDYEVAGFSAADENSWAEENGITFIHDAMHPWSKPSLDEVEKVLDLINKAEKPVLIHCQGGSDRTGVAIGAARMMNQDWDYDGTYREMLYYGFNRVEYRWQDVLKELPRKR